MRETKFRAWDKEHQGFINGFNMFGFSTGQGAPNKKLQRFNFEWSEEQFELMQYTGLKDKNSKDGFESDILETPVGRAVICFGEYSQSMGSQEYHMGFYLKFELEQDAELYRKDIGYWLPRSEIIGNIYKNPEFLKTPCTST